MTGFQTLVEEDRAVNTVVGYVIAIAITTVLLSLLITTTTAFVQVQQESVINSEMNIVGQSLSTQLMDADRTVRLNETGPEGVERTVKMPNRLANSQYLITVEDVGSFEPYAGENTYRIRLWTNSPAVEEELYFVSETDIEPTTLNGGDFRIIYNKDQDILVIRHA